MVSASTCPGNRFPILFPFLKRIQVFVILFAAKKEARVDGEVVVSSWWAWVRGSLSKDLKGESWQLNKSQSCFQRPAVVTFASGPPCGTFRERGSASWGSFGAAPQESTQRMLGLGSHSTLTRSLGTRLIWERGRGRGSRTPECPLLHGVPAEPGESRSADRGLPRSDQLALGRPLRAAGETGKARKTFSRGRSSINKSESRVRP